MLNLTELGSITDLRVDERWSAADLAQRMAAGAAALAARGIGAGDRVMIAHGDSLAFFADLLALWHRGACAVCIDPGSSEGELGNLIDFAEPSLILVPQETDLDWPEISSVPVFSTATLDLNGPGMTPEPQAARAPDDPALILFTSGSTGRPKGVVHSFRSLDARLRLNRRHIGQSDLARTLCLLPTHFGHGLIGNCLTPLLAGCDLYLMAGESLRAAMRLGPLLDEREITFLSSVPAFWRLALKAGNPPQEDSLRRVHIGSAPLSADLWRQIIDWSGCDNVVNMYGLTETANWVAGASARDYPPADGLIGTLWGGEAAVADETGVLHATGEGELWLRTPSCMSGYFKQADLTATLLRDGWLRSGDVGRIETDGTLRLTGRKRSEINRAGIKIHPEEVDLLIERHPAVAEACAFGLPDEVAGEIVAVAIRLENGRDDSERELRTWCSLQIRREARPERWFFVSKIPRTERGKLNRDAVRQACVSPTVPGEPGARAVC